MKKMSFSDRLELYWILRVCFTAVIALILIIVGILFCIDYPEMLGVGLTLIIIGIVVAIAVVIGVLRYLKESEYQDDEL